MSGFVMGLVKLRAIERSCKMILMCMADNGNDQGHNIYRSMDYLAREACCHKRTVQKKIGQMVRIGLLEDVGRKTHGRGHLRNFRLDLDALLTLFPDCHKVAEDVDPSALAGLIEDAEAEARAAGWVPQEERGQEAGSAATGTEPTPEKGGAAPPFSEGEKGGAGDQKGGAESTKGWPQRPPEPLRTVLEPYGARADAPGGDPDGPPGEPAAPPDGEPAEPSDQPPADPPVNRHWKAGREHFVRRWSEPIALSWWDDLIPLRHDDDGTLVIDVPNQAILDQVRARYSVSMEWALQQGGGQGLRFVIEGLAEKVRRSRRAAAQAQAGRAPGARAGAGGRR